MTRLPRYAFTSSIAFSAILSQMRTQWRWRSETEYMEVYGLGIDVLSAALATCRSFVELGLTYALPGCMTR